MKARILPLHWPTGAAPSTLSDFETQARRLRYQALGKACVTSDCTRLLLAHHSDDQAETGLMSLATSPTGSPTRSMTSSAPIPECWGIYGACRSGAYDQATRRDSQLDKLAGKRPAFESGGITVLRPLLSFSKEQLRQTCEDNSIVWEDDESNYDVSLTPRNTIRSLLLNTRLPRALQKASLLDLITRKASQADNEAECWTTMFENSRISQLDIRSGTLTARIYSDVSRRDDISEKNVGIAAVQYLKRIAQVVSPWEGIPLTDMVTAASIVFPILRAPEDGSSSKVNEAVSFTVSGVQFSRLPLGETPLEELHKPARACGDPNGTYYVWSLSRQPFPKLQVPESIIIPPNSSTRSVDFVQSLGETDFSIIENGGQTWSNWQLWDGRYWIRVRNQMSGTLIVRAWEQWEMSILQDQVDSLVFEKFRDALRAAAPGKIRWTLPVIAKAGHHDDQGGRNKDLGVHDNGTACADLGKILVFPTLGKAGWLDTVNKMGRRRLEWEVRYKEVALVPGRKITQQATLNPQIVTTWDDGGPRRSCVALTVTEHGESQVRARIGKSKNNHD